MAETEHECLATNELTDKRDAQSEIELFLQCLVVTANTLTPLIEEEGTDDTLEAHGVQHMETLYWEDETPKLDPSSVAHDKLFEMVQTEHYRLRLRGSGLETERGTDSEGEREKSEREVEAIVHSA